MSMSLKQEYALLKPDEIKLVRGAHHPDLYDLDRKELVALQTRLREIRGKARTISRQKSREEKGKAAPRGKSFPADGAQPKKRKQIFAAALKRVNKEVQRLQKLDAKIAHTEAAKKALAQLRASKFISPPQSAPTAGSGMAPNTSRRRNHILPRAKVGSVLKQNAIAQATRDARPT